MMNIPIAAGSGFGGLHQAVNALQHGIGAVTVGIPEDPGPVGLDGFGGLTDGIEAAMGGPEVPVPRKGLRGFRRLVPQGLKRFFDGIGPTGFEVGLAQVHESISGRHFEILRIFEPQIARTCEFGADFALLSAHLVDGVPKELHDMELVERDRGLGKVGGDPFDEGGRHIHRDVGHGGRIAVVGLKIFSEPGHRGRVFAWCGKDHGRFGRIDDDRDLMVASSGGRLVDPKRRDGG